MTLLLDEQTNEKGRSSFFINLIHSSLLPRSERDHLSDTRSFNYHLCRSILSPTTTMNFNFAMPSAAAAESSNNNNNNTNSSSDAGFDYRSLLPASHRARVNSHGDVPDDSNNTSTDDSDGCCFQLNFRERMLGFGTCVVAGYMLSFGSFWRILDLIRGHPLPLVLHTTVGNLLTWVGTIFLVGPKTQWKRLWEPSRADATKAYGISVLAIFAMIAISPPMEGLILFLLLIVQQGAMAWYCLSYIPFGQDTVWNYAGRFLNLPQLTSNTGNAASGGGEYMPAPV